jgi:hypothetical protein
LEPISIIQVNKDAELKVTKRCKIKSDISAYFIDEVEVDVLPLDVCGLVFGRPYMYMRDAILMRKGKLVLLDQELEEFHHQFV